LIKLSYNENYKIIKHIGDWGLGIGVLGVGGWGGNPNPKNPNPKPQNPKKIILF